MEAPMPDAIELNTTATTDATLLAETMFGDGIQVVSATLTGAATQAGTYTGGEATSGSVVPSDSGVILSTGDIGDFTSGGGGTDTNTAAGTSTGHGGAGDSDLDAISTVSTNDAVVFESTFIPDDNYITMQLVFSSEEYLEYVNGGVNDTLGIWVNGDFVPLTSSGDTVSIDTVNDTSNSNLYIDNPQNADTYNTEMDGFTVTLSFKAKVNAGEENTIKIGLADGGDDVYDSNVLIAADSVQTVALAFEDEVTLEANSTAVLDVLANDHDTSGNGLTITELNGQPVQPGDSVTLNTGETVTLNADYTLNVETDSDLGETVFTYMVENSDGVTDVGYVIIQTVADAPLNGIVEGSGGADLIDTGFTGDPQGDRIDAGDAIGVNGTTGDDDYVLAQGGDDTVYSGVGDDIVYGGTGDDSLFGEGGDDSLYGEGGADRLVGGVGNDLLDGGAGADLVTGGSGDDTVLLTDGFGNDTITGGETGETDGDTLDMSGVNAGVQLDLTGTDPEAGSVFENGTPGGAAGFTEIENIVLSGGRDTVHLADGGGQDAVAGFDITDSGDGTALDQLDVSNLTADGGYTPVTTAHVDVSSDPDGNAVLSFPGGESITLQGVNPLDLSTVDDLVAIGIPDGRDYIVEGTSGGDLIDAGYTGDPEGDMVDAGDALDGSDDDVIEAGAGDDTIFAGDGNDSVRGGEGNDSVEGGAGDDSLYGDEGDDTLLGGAGNDTMDGFLGADLIEGGDGNDSISGHDGDDTIYGGAGDDWLRGSVGNDEMWGGTGDDYIWSGYNDDTIRIENDFGNDTIEAEGIGETTGDVLDLSLVTDGLTIDLTDSNPENGSFSDGTSTATFNEIENIILGGGNDTVMLGPLSGDDFVQGFDLADDDGDGFTNDQLDVSQLTSDWGTTPVTAWDVTVTDTNGDGTGDAILSFPGTESITLVGITPDQVDSIPELFSIGIPCFTPGARILTMDGDKPVEEIRPGDMVLTADNGFQPVRWAGSRSLGAAELAERPELTPYVIRKHAFGNARKMRVSPQHGFVMQTDAGERLIRAKHAAELFGGEIARRDKACEAVTYIHILFDRHEIIFAEGARTEAFYPGPQALRSIDRAAAAELLALFPELARVALGGAPCADGYGPPARAYLKGRDIRAMAKERRGCVV